VRPLDNLDQLEVGNCIGQNLNVKKSRLRENQIVAILKEVEVRAMVGEACRTHGDSERTCERWKSQIAGWTVLRFEQFRESQTENTKLAPRVGRSPGRPVRR
jgi:hypothetical protein